MARAFLAYFFRFIVFPSHFTVYTAMIKQTCSSKSVYNIRQNRWLSVDMEVPKATINSKRSRSGDGTGVQKKL